MGKKNILIFKDSGFFYGSLEKLLQLFAKALSSEFNVFFAYCPSLGEQRKNYLQNSAVTLVPFYYNYRQGREPYKLKGLSPSLMEIIEKYRIDCIFTDVFANYQFPMNAVPAGVPFVLISPFGHYASNGNISLVYVSGQSNLERLKKRGVKNVKLLYNPLEDFAPEFLVKKPMDGQVIFGRIGRSENSIFDPVAVTAFKKLEGEFGSRVKYIVVNAPPAWKKLAKDLDIKNMEFREAISDPMELAKFYREIDVLAHARKDGETVGMAIGEAMLAGNPILTHKSHFHNEHFNILTPEYALWSEADDAEKYFENMKWMVGHKEQIRGMGQQARLAALKIFGMQEQLPEMIAVFNEACEKNYYFKKFGRAKGYIKLYWENLKKMPFFMAKLVVYYLG